MTALQMPRRLLSWLDIEKKEDVTPTPHVACTVRHAGTEVDAWFSGCEDCTWHSENFATEDEADNAGTQHEIEAWRAQMT